jgi:hypothetical protein
MNNITNKQLNEKQQVARQTNAWWHHGYAWLVFGGPAAVVVASLITVYIAVSHRDALVDEDYYRKGIEINKMLSDKTLSTKKSNAQLIAERNALAPAILARNHAATGVIHQQ